MRTHRWILVGLLGLGLACLGSLALGQRNPLVQNVLEIILKERGWTLDQVRQDPELQRQVREALQERRNDPGFREQIRQELLEQERAQKQGSTGRGYEVIVQQNLFKPLGSGEERKGPPYALQVTIIPPNGGPKRAIILEFAGNRLHDVAEGDRIGNAVVELIEPRHVRLKSDEGPIDLRIEDLQFISGAGGGKGRPRGGTPRGGTPPEAKAPSKEAGERMVERARNLREQFRGRSPEEIRRMMQERMRQLRQQGRQGGRRRPPTARGGERPAREVPRDQQRR